MGCLPGIGRKVLGGINQVAHREGVHIQRLQFVGILLHERLYLAGILLCRLLVTALDGSLHFACHLLDSSLHLCGITALESLGELCLNILGGILLQCSHGVDDE